MVNYRFQHYSNEYGDEVDKMRLTEQQKSIIRSMCDNNLSISAVARELSYHRNSIMYHVTRIHEITGLNPQRYYDLAKLEEMIQ